MKGKESAQDDVRVHAVRVVPHSQRLQIHVQSSAEGKDKEKKRKGSMVAFAHTVVDPRTVMIEPSHTAVAVLAVLGARLADNLTSDAHLRQEARLEELLIF